MKKILGLLSIKLSLGLNAAQAQTKATDLGVIPNPVAQEAQATQPEVFAYVEQMPEYVGGQTNLIKYLSSNIKYPKAEQEAGIQGKVFVKFIVNEDGSISDVEIARSSGSKALDTEAKRVVASMPKWKPGKQNGKAVKTRYNLPVAFRLETNETAPQK